jgi:hypothetical protein
MAVAKATISPQDQSAEPDTGPGPRLKKAESPKRDGHHMPAPSSLPTTVTEGHLHCGAITTLGVSSVGVLDLDSLAALAT